MDRILTLRQASGTTLHSLGYTSIGIDEGWEGWYNEAKHETHDPNGVPQVNTKRFPDMPALVRYGHSKGVQMGFYLNGCGANERVEKRINYEGDVKATIGWGFDGVKIDSCGAQKNMTLYYQLFNATGKPVGIENCHQGQNITDGGNPGQMGKGWCPYNWFRTSGDIVNEWDRVMSNLMTVDPFLSPDPRVNVSHSARSTTGRGEPEPPLSRPGCWAYPDMLEVGRMPEHNAAESRSHFAAWAVVSAPLILGFDLSNRTKVAEAWPAISNREVIGISQTWVRGAPYPSGKLLKSWRAPNVPTIVRRPNGRCDDSPCVDDEPVKCVKWAQAGQCAANPGYMLTHCRVSCHSCGMSGNYTGWRFNATGPHMLSNGVGDEAVCLDTRGQLPGGHGGSNVLHALPCDPSASSQRWHFNGIGGAIASSAVSATADHAAHQASPESSLCLNVWRNWLWAFPLVHASSCDAAHPRSNEQWTLAANGTLSNGQFGCVEVSRDTGPPSTIWAKPLEGGKMALLAINGADALQRIKLNFAELLGDHRRDHQGAGLQQWEVRDVWMGVDLGRRAGLSRNVPPHDCILLILSPVHKRDA